MLLHRSSLHRIGIWSLPPLPPSVLPSLQSFPLASRLSICSQAPSFMEFMCVAGGSEEVSVTLLHVLLYKAGNVSGIKRLPDTLGAAHTLCRGLCD